MTILVDDPIWPAHGRRFAHMISDAGLEELHAFAAALGLPGRAFHADHYDLPIDWWPRAVAGRGSAGQPSRAGTTAPSSGAAAATSASVRDEHCRQNAR